MARIVDGHRRALVRTTASLTRRTALKGFGAAGLATVVASTRLGSVAAQDASPAAGADLESYPEVEIIGRDYSFEMPVELAGGLTRVTLVNEGHEDHHAIFIRLGDEVTAEEIEAAMAQPDPFQLPMLGDVLGGPNGAAPGGGRATVILDLAPGSYLVVCVVPDAEFVPHYMMGMYATATVTESASSLPAPDAAQTIELVDFAFDHLPAAVAAGPQVWEVTNVGQELHELVLLQLAPGVTFEALAGMLAGEGPPADEATPEGADHGTEDHAASPAAELPASPAAVVGPPFTQVAGTAPKAPGMTNWLVLDLEPGAYVAICFIPSPANGFAPHFVLGMIMPFVVA